MMVGMSKRAKVSVGKAGSAPASVGEVHYWCGGHTRHRCLSHIVFCPKYRHRLLEGALSSRLKELLLECCGAHDWFVQELSVQPDHVHLLIQVSPTDRLCDVVKYLKGGSSRVIRAEFSDLTEFEWSSSLWSDGYFLENIGHRDEVAVRRYIRSQRKSLVGKSESGKSVNSK